MKRLSLIILLSMLLTAVVYADAVITFKNTTMDWGEIDRGEITTLNFEFENTGDSLLTIKRIRSTCGCTVAHVKKKEFKPGEKGNIPVKFHSGSYRGRVLKTITVITNAKENNGYTNLKLTGLVKIGDIAQCRISPDKVLLKEVFLKEPQVRKLAIVNDGTLDLKILELTHHPAISLKVDKILIKPKETAELTVSFDPYVIGNHQSFIKVRTNQYGRSVSLIKFKAFVLNK